LNLSYSLTNLYPCLISKLSYFIRLAFNRNDKHKRLQKHLQSIPQQFGGLYYQSKQGNLTEELQNKYSAFILLSKMIQSQDI
jgi:hypothetical protein